MKPVQGRVTVAYPADVDVASAARLLQRALRSPASTTSVCLNGAEGLDSNDPPPRMDHHAVSINNVSKASITLDFLVSNVHTVAGSGAATPPEVATGNVSSPQVTSPGSYVCLTSEEVAARLSAVPTLRAELSACVAALVPPHRETYFGFSRNTFYSRPSATVGAGLVQPTEFDTLCASGVLRIVDNALFSAVQDVLRDTDHLGDHRANSCTLPRAATHRALCEAFERNCERLVYAGGEPPSTTTSAADKRRECSASPLPRIGDCQALQLDGTDDASQPMVATKQSFSDKITQTMADDGADQQRVEDNESSRQRLEQLSIDMACLREELQCMESANRVLEHDLHNACTARNAAVAECRHQTEHIAALGATIEQLRVECSTWRTRAQEATDALMIPLTPGSGDPQEAHAGGGGDGLRRSDLSEGEQLLTRLLDIREAQVGKLNTQLIASRKETVELRKKLSGGGALSSDAVCSSCQSRSSSCNGASQSRSSSTDASTAHAEIIDDASLWRRGGGDMVPRVAVNALEKRCEAAERELRERTMQMAQLLKVSRHN